MKRSQYIFFLMLTFLFFISEINAQQQQPIPEVEIDFVKQRIAQPVPFDTKLLFTGTIDKAVKRVEINIQSKDGSVSTTPWIRGAFTKEATKFYVESDRLDPNSNYLINVNISQSLGDNHPFIRDIEEKFVGEFRVWNAQTEFPDFEQWQDDFVKYIIDGSPSNVSVTLPKNKGLLDTTVVDTDSIFWYDIQSLFNGTIRRSRTLTNFNKGRDITQKHLDAIINDRKDLAEVFSLIVDKPWDKNLSNQLADLVILSGKSPSESWALANGLLSIDHLSDKSYMNMDALNTLWKEDTMRLVRLEKLAHFFSSQRHILEEISLYNEVRPFIPSGNSIVPVTIGRLDKIIDALTKQRDKLTDYWRFTNDFNSAVSEILKQLSFDLNTSVLLAGTTRVFDLSTASKLYVSADFGIAGYGTKVENGLEPNFALYYGANIFFRPINSKVPINSFWEDRLLRGLSVNLGVTATDINIEGERKGLIGNKGLLIGAGIHPFRGVKLSGGYMLYKMRTNDPLTDEYTPKALSYISVSVHADVFNALGTLVQKLGF